MLGKPQCPLCEVGLSVDIVGPSQPFRRRSRMYCPECQRGLREAYQIWLQRKRQESEGDSVV